MQGSTRAWLGEGVRTGLVGAAAVAVWFLIRDLAVTQAGWTPSILGQVILLGERTPDTSRVLLAPALAYTAVHLLAFAAFGIVFTRLVILAENQRIFRTALVMLFVTFEVFFAGLLEIGFEATRGLFPLWTVLAANGVAALCMGLYEFRKHPAVARAFLREAWGY